ncbi:hypothetical protein B0H13DRAFT_1887610 [Mycena leptocephala]|nr:hypothetical protein B0H13DRAFT_1887610 [Mycena leptocephala]
MPLPSVASTTLHMQNKYCVSGRHRRGVSDDVASEQPSGNSRSYANTTSSATAGLRRIHHSADAACERKGSKGDPDGGIPIAAGRAEMQGQTCITAPDGKASNEKRYEDLQGDEGVDVKAHGPACGGFTGKYSITGGPFASGRTQLPYRPLPSLLEMGWYNWLLTVVSIQDQLVLCHLLYPRSAAFPSSKLCIEGVLDMPKFGGAITPGSPIKIRNLTFDFPPGSNVPAPFRIQEAKRNVEAKHRTFYYLLNMRWTWYLVKYILPI